MEAFGNRPGSIKGSPVKRREMRAIDENDGRVKRFVITFRGAGRLGVRRESRNGRERGGRESTTRPQILLRTILLSA